MSINQRLTQPFKMSMLALVLVGSSILSANAIANEVTTDNTVKEQHQQHKKGMKKAHHKKAMAKIFKRLGLSEEQKSQMKTLKEQAKVEKAQYESELAAYHEKRKALMSAEAFDEAGFSNLNAEYQNTFAQLALLQAKTRFAMKSVLTEEQITKLEKFKRRGGKDRKGSGERRAKS